MSHHRFGNVLLTAGQNIKRLQT